MAEDIARALNDEQSIAHVDLVRAWIFYDLGDLESSRRYNHSSLPPLIKTEPSWESFNKAGHDFLEGMIDLQGGDIESTASRMEDLDSLVQSIPRSLSWSLREGDMAGFEAKWLIQSR